MKLLSKITAIQVWYTVLFLTLVVAGANVIDTFLYYGAFERYFFIDSRLLTTIWIGMALAARYWLGEMPIQLSKFLKFIQIIGLPLAVLATLGLTSLEISNFPNYVFSTWRVHYDQAFFFVVLFSGLALIRQSQAFFQKHWRTLVFVSPLIGWGIIHLMKTWPADYWLLQVNHDDAGVENLQVVSLAVMSITSMYLARFLHKRGKKIAILFLLTALGSFFVLGEEISWGQRIFNIETPEALEEINTQGELTLHNLVYFQNWLRLAYQVIAGVGLILCSIKWLGWLPAVQKKMSYLFPDRALISWFIAFFFLDLTFGGSIHERWFEVAELVIYTVFAMHFFLLWKNRKQLLS